MVFLCSWFKGPCFSSFSSWSTCCMRASFPNRCYPKHRLSHLRSDLSKDRSLQQNGTDVYSYQLCLTSWWTSSYPSHHCLEREIRLFLSLISPHLTHVGTWSEIGLLSAIAIARRNLAFQSSETMILSSFAKLGSSLILDLDYVYRWSLNGISTKTRSLIRC